MAEKKDIVVARKFDFTHPDGTATTFKPGLHRGVDAAVADHWFVQAHLHQEEEAEPTEEKAAQQSAQQGGNGRRR